MVRNQRLTFVFVASSVIFHCCLTKDLQSEEVGSTTTREKLFSQYPFRPTPRSPSNPFLISVTPPTTFPKHLKGHKEKTFLQTLKDSAAYQEERSLDISSAKRKQSTKRKFESHSPSINFDPVTEVSQSKSETAKSFETNEVFLKDDTENKQNTSTTNDNKKSFLPLTGPVLVYPESIPVATASFIQTPIQSFNTFKKQPSIKLMSPSESGEEDNQDILTSGTQISELSVQTFPDDDWQPLETSSVKKPPQNDFFQQSGVNNSPFKPAEVKIPSISFESEENVFLPKRDVSRSTKPPINSGKDVKRVVASNSIKEDYTFLYKVSDEKALDYGHSESIPNPTLSGRKEGQYHVLLPNGKMLRVNYYADETGFHPTLEYI